jgi:hypothetical protein
MNRIFLMGLSTVLFISCKLSTQNKKEMKTEHQGVTEKDFEQSARAMQKDFLEKQNGFIKRTLTVSEDSVWTDIVFWKNQEGAEKTMKLAETSELVLPFVEKIDFNSVKMSHTTPVIIEE